MGQYVVQHNYRSVRDGIPFGPWAEGDQIFLEPADAAWVNRDSPGCLTQVGEPGQEAVKEPKERAAKPGPNRQHRGSANRGV